MSDPTPNSRQSLDSRNGWWTASIAVIVLVLATLAAVLLLGGNDEPQAAVPTPTPTAQTPTSGSTPTTQTPASPTTTPTDGSCTSPAADDQEVPDQPPADTRWDVYNTVALPWSPTSGPTVRDGAVWSCYARTPDGALNAATVLSTTPYGLGAEEVLEEQVVEGPARDAQLESARRESPPPAAPGSTGVVAGFRFLDYSADRATVQVAFTYGGEYFVWTTPLEWVDGDWKLNLDPSGGAVPGQPIADLQGFNEWGAS